MFRAVYPPLDPRTLHLHTKTTKQQRKYFSYSMLLDSGIYFHLQFLLRLSPLARSPLITSKITNRADYPGPLVFFFDSCIIKCV